MTKFSTDWLTLREPFDHRARCATWCALDVAAHAARWRSARPSDPVLAVIDLACGSGANLRALAPRIGGPQRWRLIDHDAALLAAVPQALAGWAQQHAHRITNPSDPASALRIAGAGFSVELVTEQADLAHGLDAIDWRQAHLVTASALLDLVSAAWLTGLVRVACDHGAALLFALSVDGRTAWDPVDVGDAEVHRLFALHQQRDKGFGDPALGPAALPLASRLLAQAGYTVLQARSDWNITGALAPAMVGAMVEGMAAAATEQAPQAADVVQQWKARRMAAVAVSRLSVGHNDIMALPPMVQGPGPTAGRVP
ncbi:MAG: hypothetical protein ABIN37_17165 [Burkholderiaceae bacterium]